MWNEILKDGVDPDVSEAVFKKVLKSMINKWWDDLIMDLNAEKSHHADNVDDNCYTSILWNHCVTWQPLYAILLFWFMC